MQTQTQKPPSLGQRFYLVLGKLVRFFVVFFRPEYVKRQLALRRGYCNRCGACCEIGFKCMFLEKKGEMSRCRIYGFRFSQCALFPMNPFDLKSVKDVCSFHFEKEPQPLTLPLPPVTVKPAPFKKMPKPAVLPPHERN